MARMNTTTLPKFRRLASELKLPDPYVLGHLEMLWQYAHQTRQSILYARDIELIVHWQGEEGAFLDAAIKHEWLDSSVVGMVEIHDYENNAPEFVKTAIRMKEYRKRKQENKESEKKRRVTERYVTERNSDITIHNSSELLRIEREREREREEEIEVIPKLESLGVDIKSYSKTQVPVLPPSKPARAQKSLIDDDQIESQSSVCSRRSSPSTPAFSTGFLAVWKAYPHYGGRSSKAKSWDKWRMMRLDAVAGLPELILSWVEHLKLSADWQKQDGQFVPAMQVWLANRIWTNGEPPVTEKKELACEWETE